MKLMSNLYQIQVKNQGNHIKPPFSGVISENLFLLQLYVKQITIVLNFNFPRLIIFKEELSIFHKTCDHFKKIHPLCFLTSFKETVCQISPFIISISNIADERSRVKPFPWSFRKILPQCILKEILLCQMSIMYSN